MANHRKNYESDDHRTSSGRRSTYGSDFRGDEYRSDDLRFDTDYDRSRMDRDREFNGGEDRSYGQQGQYRSRSSQLDDQFRPSFRNERSQTSGRSSRSTSDYDSLGAMGTSSWQGSSYGTRDSASRLNHFGKGPKGWKRSDERIREDVCERLERDGRVDASDIDVSVQEGVVTLSGRVEDRPTKRHAEDIIEYLPGVKDVRNDLTVDQSFFTQAKEMIMGKSESDKTTSSRSGGKTVPH